MNRFISRRRVIAGLPPMTAASFLISPGAFAETRQENSATLRNAPGKAELYRQMYTPGSRLPGERNASYQRERDVETVRAWRALHAGLGTVGVKLFGFGRAAIPVNFATYDIPPGASEGVHTHLLDDPVEGSFDEFYYIVSGRGEMRIGQELIGVEPGDHVFTPIGTPHGIANVSLNENLKVFLTYLYR